MVSLTSATIAVVLCILAASTDAARLGQWRTLPERSLSSVFRGGDYSFNVKGNLAYCRKRTIRINVDGTSDYTTKFNKALASLGKSGGGRLLLGKGTFPHSGQIAIPSYVCLVGSGMGRTIIKLKNNSKKFKYSGSIRSIHTERVTVMDLTQDGNKGNQKKSASYGRYGYFHELTNYVYLKNVRIQNNYGYGFDPHGSKKYWSYYLVMEGCQSTGNGIDGITLDQTKHVSMLNSKSWGNTRHGFNLVTGLRTAVVKGNTAYNNGLKIKNGCGFMAQNNQDYKTRNIRFLNNVATNNYKAGFCLNDVSGILIRGSTISKAPSSSTYCFQITDTTGKNIIKGNTCKLPSNRVVKQKSAKFSISGGSGSTRAVGGKSGRSSAPRPNAAGFKFASAADPRCSKGVADKSVCCPKGCGKCGGSGCGSRGPNSVCCSSGVKRLKRSCKSTGAPCVSS